MLKAHYIGPYKGAEACYTLSKQLDSQLDNTLSPFVFIYFIASNCIIFSTVWVYRVVFYSLKG